MLGRRKFPKLMTLVAVEWVDITSTVNANLAESRPAKCTTTGHLVKRTDDFIVIATSIFEDADPDINGDFLAIPLGVLLKIRRL